MYMYPLAAPPCWKQTLHKMYRVQECFVNCMAYRWCICIAYLQCVCVCVCTVYSIHVSIEWNGTVRMGRKGACIVSTGSQYICMMFVLGCKTQSSVACVLLYAFI